ncbi:MAG: RimK family alpha-L-glutamate ligase [Methanothrix sp.]|nr:RimK family alpha-L-glutamate ligase [Methanothrix sp.]
MRFGVVISDPEDWTARAIRASLIDSGADALFLSFSDLVSTIQDGLLIRSQGQDLLDLDGIVVRDLGRRGAQDVAFRLETLHALEALGIPVVNPPEAIARAANKYATSLALKGAGVPTPRTTITTSATEAIRALREYGRAVSKPLFGYKGRGIMLLQEGDEERLIELLRAQGLVYLQEFISHERPRDIRAFVVGGRVMGAIFRVAPPGEWISNLARGGRAEPCRVYHELEDLAVRSSRAVGAVYSGVDLLETQEGLKVIEVNGTPSGRGIFEACRVDVTGAIAEHMISIV